MIEWACLNNTPWRGDAYSTRRTDLILCSGYAFVRLQYDDITWKMKTR